jgi:hypothetical protein
VAGRVLWCAEVCLSQVRMAGRVLWCAGGLSDGQTNWIKFIPFVCLLQVRVGEYLIIFNLQFNQILFYQYDDADGYGIEYNPHIRCHTTPRLYQQLYLYNVRSLLARCVLSAGIGDVDDGRSGIVISISLTASDIICRHSSVWLFSY